MALLCSWASGPEDEACVAICCLLLSFAPSPICFMPFPGSPAENWWVYGHHAIAEPKSVFALKLRPQHTQHPDALSCALGMAELREGTAHWLRTAAARGLFYNIYAVKKKK